jgi:hypothetical protein
VDSTVLFILHGSLNRSTLDNGCIVYEPARKLWYYPNCYQHLKSVILFWNIDDKHFHTKEENAAMSII